MKRKFCFLCLIFIISALFAETVGNARNRFNRQQIEYKRLSDRYLQNQDIYNAAILIGATFGQRNLAQVLYDSLGDSFYLKEIEFYQSVEDLLNKVWFTPNLINIYSNETQDFYNKECHDLFEGYSRSFSGAYMSD